MNARTLLAAIAILLGMNASGHAASLVYSISLNTSSLAASASSGPFVFDAQLNDGGEPGNNTALFSNFSFGGGSPFGSPTLAGGALGSFATGITLADSSFLNELRQSFQAGAQLSFTLSLTTNRDMGGTPDEFSLAILDNNGTELPTTSAALYGTSVILLADLTDNQTQLASFGSAPGAAILFPAPAVVASDNSIPEPSTTILTIGGLIAALCLRCLTICRIARRT